MKKKPEDKIDEDWMSTYGDMVTLLLCFFQKRSNPPD